MKTSAPNYWSFKAVVDSFVRAHKRGIQTCNNGGLYRVNGTKALVIRPPRLWDFSDLIANNPKVMVERFRTLPMETIPDLLPHEAARGAEYIATAGYEIPSRVKRAHRRAGRVGIQAGGKVTKSELRQLVSQWRKWAGKRHEMVVIGHYLSMIDTPGFGFRAYRIDGKLVAAIGYTIDGAHACISFCKHLEVGWWLAPYVWSESISRLLSKVRTVNCGDTADGLKRSIGLLPKTVRVLRKSVALKKIEKVKQKAYSTTGSWDKKAAAALARDEERELACFEGAFNRIDSDQECLSWFHSETTVPGYFARMTPSDGEDFTTSFLGKVLVLGYPSHSLLHLIRKDVIKFENAFLSSGFPSAIVYCDTAGSRFLLNRARYEQACGMPLPKLDDYWIEVARFWRRFGAFRLDAVFHHRRAAYLVLIKEDRSDLAPPETVGKVC